MKISDVMPTDMPPQQGGPPQAGQPQQAPQQPQEAAPPEGEEQAQGGDQATPEEQEAIDKVVMAAMKVIHDDDNTHAQVMQMLKTGADSPAETLAEVTKTIMLQLDEKSGGTIPEVAIFPAAEQILELVGELAEASGLMQIDEATSVKAQQLMILGVADAYGVDPEELSGLMGSVSPEEMNAMVAQQDEYARSGQAQQQPRQASPPPPQGRGPIARGMRQ